VVRLSGVCEVAELLGVSRQRVSQLAEKPDFLKPIDRIAAGPGWRLSDVKARAKGRGLRKGLGRGFRQLETTKAYGRAWTRGVDGKREP
jgi:hypothetical protein